ncbi:MAG: MBL fold metallo-hydrolase [Calditrichia bacterium]
MKFGTYDVYRIHAGDFKLDGGAMFGVVPKVLWSKKKPTDEFNRIEMCTNLLLLKSDSHTVLIDTGNGYKEDEKFRSIFALDYSNNDLFSSLAQYDIKPEDITDVILTHLHFDHAGGATSYNSDKDLFPTFPNATYHIHRKQYEWALNPSQRDRASYYTQNFIPLVEQKRVNWIDLKAFPLPGIQLIEVNGHTPGQVLPLIEDPVHPLLYGGDLIPMYPHVALPWIMGYDLFPLTTLEEKHTLVPRAANENWIIFFEHDPEVYAATVKEGEKNYEINEIINLE